MFRLKSSHASLFLQCAALCALCTLVISLLPVVSAQSATATVSGVVTDEKQAVITKATITAVNEATRLTRKATSNDDGYFTIPLLPPSNYTLTVERDGFASARVPNVVLNVGDQRSLQIQLKVGQVDATVNVTDQAPLINESPAVGTVVDRQFVENLPLNGRSFQSLISLTPGIVTAASSITEPGQFSVNGQRSDANYFTVDGVSANAASTGGAGTLGQSASGSVPATSALGGTNNLVSVDALQEFRVQTSTFAPEFGRTPGAQVQIVTRPGTNAFTGTVFEYFRNGALDANDWFANSRGLPRPELRQNDFGGVLGGPIIKDKTFFFFSYEGLRLSQPVVRISTVPSLCVRGQGGCPAGIPPADARLRPILNAYPLPNGRDLGNGLAEFNASFTNPSSLDATSIRVDHSLGARLTLFGRYNHAPSDSTKRGVFSLSTVGPVQVATDTLTLGATWVISTSTINEFRFNYSKTQTAARVPMERGRRTVARPQSRLIRFVCRRHRPASAATRVSH
ncbi:MAG: carboxypeptidase regulatory-like domain-containing protein [Blastocatellia bacterium]